MEISFILPFAIGCLVTAAIGFIVHRSKLNEVQNTLSATTNAQLTVLGEKLKAAEHRLNEAAEIEQQISEKFKALSLDALKSNNESFLSLARSQFEKLQETNKLELDSRKISIDEMVKPIKESLSKVDGKLEELERLRIEAHSSLVQQLKSLSETNTTLKDETANLIKALRQPQIRGRWGEIQLRKVVELSGMLENCDFVTQESVEVEGSQLRPDMVIKLPSNRNIVVDSKAPLDAYLSAIEARSEAEKEQFLESHARQIRNLITGLSSKSYWEHLKPTPEFVVLFIPGEAFLSAALERDRELLEFAASKNIILATPSTLIALLKAVYYGWRQDKMAQNTAEVAKIGKEFHERINKFLEHFDGVRRGLEGAVSAFNKSASSLESRVLVSVRKFKELGIDSTDDIRQVNQIETTPQTIAYTSTGQE
jgi:DNA recombination protein RmuC